MAPLRREVSSILLLLAAVVLFSCVHITQAIDWLPWWTPAPVRHLLGRAAKASQATCPPDPKTCANGAIIQPQPELNCKYSDCPDESWTIYCDPNCNGVDTCEEHCSGSESMSVVCPDAVPCTGTVHSTTACEPRDCELGQWTEWAGEGCTGLCNRTRPFKENACGGAPCFGRLHETEWCASPCNVAVDCSLSDWSVWGQCDLNRQRHSSRHVIRAASGDGDPCEGMLERTESCIPSTETKTNCKLSDWMSWSGCTATCGGGQTRRIRGIADQAAYGGKPCHDAALLSVRSCGTTKCSVDLSKAVDCTLADWSPWSFCGSQASGSAPSAGSSTQRSRQRGVAVKASLGGKACNSSMEEVAPCKKTAATPVNCGLSAWDPWAACTKTCDGGQTYRHRDIKTSATNGGVLCADALQETRVCNQHSCAGGMQSGNCQLATWGSWSGCTETCGQGMETRERTVIREAAQGGTGCANPVSEVRGCPIKECEAQDCLWADWTRWSRCSRTCGKGTVSRARTVKLEPKGVGKPCKALDSTVEIKECSLQECNHECIDGIWGLWTAWTTCTRSCGGGAQWRHRNVIHEANSCGNPADGSSSEFKACSTGPCEGEANCKLSEWDQWASCSSSCAGTQGRLRTITTNSSGAGRACQADLSLIRSCDGSSAEACGTEKQDCQMSDWEQWSPCSVTCEGGQKLRKRKVVVYASNGGKSCKNSLEEIGGCTMPVKCDPKAKDCEYSPWNQWSSCSQCDGERTRTREITSYAFQGVGCDHNSLKEVGRCQRHCGGKTLYYCVWGPFENGPCSASCGKGALLKTRHMQKLEALPTDPKQLVGKLHEDWETCNGTQVLHSNCVAVGFPTCTSSCIPQDCTFSQWSTWSHPTGKDCNGLCWRNRSIASPSNECGKSCQGAIKSTKPCVNAACAKQDCTWTSWSAWDTGSCNHEEGQRYRTRAVKHPPLRGGNACVGSLRQTASCDSTLPEPVACELSLWGNWGACDKTCGDGQRFRERAVQTTAMHGGQPCTGPMRMVHGCQSKDCSVHTVDCKLAEWTMWFGCKNRHGDQAFRTRLITVAAEGAGEACTGSLRMTGECGSLQPVNCELSSWDDWGGCDATCGSGQKFRTREVEQQLQNGGMPCVDDLHTTAPCNTDPCPSTDNCEVSTWSDWSACEPKCGQGTSTRTRKITQPPADGAAGCTLDLKQAVLCKGKSCPGIQDCEMNDWADWSGCVKAAGCGVGYRDRKRLIIKEAGVGGHPCDVGALHEARADEHCPGTCHEHCVDGEWEDWHVWGPCSVTCGQDGKKKRLRYSLQASHCGFPAEGPDTEYGGCSSSVPCAGHKDCTWTGWSSYSDCSASCSGSKSRSRKVKSHAEMGGRPCHGGIVETARCNPSGKESAPAGCPHTGVPEDCVLAVWSQWSECSRPCETGYKARHRKVQTPPKNGGKNCETTLSEMTSCNSQKCKTKGQNCVFASWQTWSDCDPHTSSMNRVRDIAVQAIYGQDCEGTTEEVRGCKSTCDAGVEHLCVWSLWSSWSSCSKTCGPEGRISRARKLIATREKHE